MLSKKWTEKTGILVIETPDHIKTDIDYPYGPAHRDHPDNKYSRENPDEETINNKGRNNEED